jgi:DNA repair protein RadC
LSGPEDVFRYLKGAFEFRPEQEQLWCILLDAKLHPIGRYLVSLGTVSSTISHPREVFKAAIIASSTSIILAHNHPSGSLEPSREDIDFTGRLREAGEIVGIEVLDHVIIAGESWRSIPG